MEFTLHNILAATITSMGMVGGIILLLNLFTIEKGSKKANRFLIFLVVLMNLRILENFILYSGLYSWFPHIIFFFFPFSALIGPLFYFHILYLCQPDRSFKWFDLLHLGLFFYIYYAGHWDFTLLSGAMKIDSFKWFSNPNRAMTAWGFGVTAVRLCLSIGYMFGSLRLLFNKRKALEKQSANPDITYLERFKRLIQAHNLYLLLTLCIFIYLYIMRIAAINVEYFLFIPFSILLILFAILTLKQPEKFLLTLQIETIPVIQDNALQPNLQASEITQTLHQIMETQKPHFNPALRIHDLAKLANLPVRKLSDIINKDLGLSFFDLVNEYRVKDFKRLAVNTKYANYTLLAIAQEVGFNSKASFNRIFKKQTGQTPSQFIAAQKVSSTEIESSNA